MPVNVAHSAGGGAAAYAVGRGQRQERKDDIALQLFEARRAEAVRQAQNFEQMDRQADIQMMLDRSRQGIRQEDAEFQLDFAQEAGDLQFTTDQKRKIDKFKANHEAINRALANHELTPGEAKQAHAQVALQEADIKPSIRKISGADAMRDVADLFTAKDIIGLVKEAREMLTTVGADDKIVPPKTEDVVAAVGDIIAGIAEVMKSLTRDPNLNPDPVAPPAPGGAGGVAPAGEEQVTLDEAQRRKDFIRKQIEAHQAGTKYDLGSPYGKVAPGGTVKAGDRTYNIPGPGAFGPPKETPSAVPPVEEEAMPEPPEGLREQLKEESAKNWDETIKLIAKDNPGLAATLSNFEGVKAWDAAEEALFAMKKLTGGYDVWKDTTAKMLAMEMAPYVPNATAWNAILRGTKKGAPTFKTQISPPRDESKLKEFYRSPEFQFLEEHPGIQDIAGDFYHYARQDPYSAVMSHSQWTGSVGKGSKTNALYDTLIKKGQTLRDPEAAAAWGAMSDGEQVRAVQAMRTSGMRDIMNSIDNLRKLAQVAQVYQQIKSQQAQLMGVREDYYPDGRRRAFPYIGPRIQQ